MNRAGRLAGLALAGLIGVGLAVVLFPSPPAPPEAPAAPERPKKKASASRADPGERVEEPRRSEGSNAERPGPRADAGPPQGGREGPEGEGGPLPPPPGRAGDPISRHLLVDADGWVRLAENLAEAGLKNEAQQAGRLARSMRDASNKPRDQLDDLFIQERELLVSLQQSAVGAEVEDQLMGLEMGLTAAQQGGVHPVDLPKKNQGSPSGVGKSPDTGLK